MSHDEELVVVYTTNDALEAEVLKSALAEEDIDCFIEGESQAGLTGLTSMEIKLRVAAKHAETARAFIQDHPRAMRDEEE